MTLDELVIGYFDNLQKITVVISIFACLVSFGCSKLRGGSGNSSLGQAATWGAIPNGVAFLICAAYPQHITKITDVTIAFTLGGLALILIPFFDLKFSEKNPA
ncbi:hypothetical protein H3222_24630 [Pseudomonas chengduensis]|jgi:hypothetical protein|nr:hypothetical protein [Pseudomonas chengduensis]MBG0848389.1 hypothetical protein [Pseudomonas chengduensis]